MKISLKKVRLSFPDLFEASAINDGEPRFGACFIIEPGSANAKAIDAEIERCGSEKWQKEWTGIKKALESKDKMCFRKSEKLNASGVVYGGFEDKHWIQASNKSRPVIVDRDKSPLVQADGKPYSGCYVNATVDLWAQDNSFGKRINATLLGVQFDSDGDAFSGGEKGSADDFDDLGEGAGEDDLV